MVGHRRAIFIGSGLSVLVALVVLAIPPALRPGIEFTAGTTTLIRFTGEVKESDLRAAYADLGHAEARVQQTETNHEFLIRTNELHVPEGSFSEVAPSTQTAVKPIGPEAAAPIGTLVVGREGASGNVPLRSYKAGPPCELPFASGSLSTGTKVDVLEAIPNCPEGTAYKVVTPNGVAYLSGADIRDFQRKSATETSADRGERSVIESALRDRFGEFEVREFASVSAVVSKAAVRNAALAVVVSSLFILGYIAFAFSSLPRPFRFGVCAVVALLHDVIITLGIFSLLGKVLGVEVNLMFVTGLLTVIGFSVHDTIVVFDRIRENVRRSPALPFATNVNAALLQTIARSLNTSITVLITVATMLALGGSTIQSFLLVILVGVISGTFSSIGIASQLLVAWELGELDRLFFWRRRTATKVAA